VEAIQVGDIYERGDSRRVISEVDPLNVYAKVQIIYSLYRRDRCWSQSHGWHDLWVLFRKGCCSMATFRRWLRGATKLSTDTARAAGGGE
jgi:hypothetical protein